jgi:hypothetical protein
MGNQGYLSGRGISRVASILPEAKVIGSRVEIPDMVWIWEVFRFLISPES